MIRKIKKGDSFVLWRTEKHKDRERLAEEICVTVLPNTLPRRLLGLGKNLVLAIDNAGFIYQTKQSSYYQPSELPVWSQINLSNRIIAHFTDAVQLYNRGKPIYFLLADQRAMPCGVYCCTRHDQVWLPARGAGCDLCGVNA